MNVNNISAYHRYIDYIKWGERKVNLQRKLSLATNVSADEIDMN